MINILIFDKYINICIGLLALLNNFNRHNYISYETGEFIVETFTGDDIDDIKNTINQAEIKNALKKSGSVNKFNLKVYAYVYDQLLIFPRSEMEYETITTNSFFFTCSSTI